MLDNAATLQTTLSRVFNANLVCQQQQQDNRTVFRDNTSSRCNIQQWSPSVFKQASFRTPTKPDSLQNQYIFRLRNLFWLYGHRKRLPLIPIPATQECHKPREILLKTRYKLPMDGGKQKGKWSGSKEDPLKGPSSIDSFLGLNYWVYQFERDPNAHAHIHSMHYRTHMVTELIIELALSHSLTLQIQTQQSQFSCKPYGCLIFWSNIAQAATRTHSNSLWSNIKEQTWWN